jgi:putative Holliday junction resolvase
MSERLPSQGRLGGIDFGTVRIGIALTDPDRILSSPWETYTRRTPQLDETFFQGLAREERLVGWVVGLPLHMSGDESQKSLEARAFGKWLQDSTQLPVEFFDERYSSSFAKEVLGQAGMSRKGKKKRVDQLAAQIILQGYLEWSQSRARMTSEEVDQSSPDAAADGSPDTEGLSLDDRD